MSGVRLAPAPPADKRATYWLKRNNKLLPRRLCIFPIKFHGRNFLNKASAGVANSSHGHETPTKRERGRGLPSAAKDSDGKENTKYGHKLPV